MTLKMTENIENTDKTSLNRTELLNLLADSVKIIAGKVTSKRVVESDGDSIRLQYARALAQLSTPLLAAMRDKQLDEIEKRLISLEERSRES